MGLLLQAVDVTGPLRWRWLLSDEETGVPVADHRVDLDPASDQVVRFRDLYGYTRLYAAPDRRTADELRIVSEAGAWAGRELLGEAVAAAVVAEAPVTVRVAVPAPADPVLLWPLELAHAHGRPLAARGDVTLVYDIGSADGRKDQVTRVLRMLAVFSQPTRTSVLALRRERYALTRLIRRIVARERALVELRVVQYGVTRQRLREIADSADGWDVLHLSGHGGRGLFLLEHVDGTPDPVDTADLIELLRLARRRVKLAVLSACQSAADTTAETLRLVGLPDQAGLVEAEPGGRTATEVTGVARALVRELDCAVVAMRYPVTDEFAIAFGDAFYEHLLSRGHRVDVAAARALAEAAGAEPSAARPAVSLATPGVFGPRAVGLTLAVPRGQPRMDLAEPGMAYFPDEPERFVGRAAAMAEASAALAPGSSRTAVLLHGMAGAGKTACALELAYRHQHGFAAAAFWQAPTREDEWSTALPGLAARLDIQFGDYGFTMASHIGTAAALEAFLPRLRQVMKDSGVLLVLDNLETLLTPEGVWRDPRWGPLITALTGHNGESRLIMTSRVMPTGLGPEVAILPVHALSLAEAAALARELPNLRSLLHADSGPIRTATDTKADRKRVRRVLRVVQGHPKLLELADAAAVDRDRLDAQLTAAEAATGGQQLEAFFREGATTLDPGQFLDALSGWTITTMAILPPSARLMAEFLACLEDDDRRSVVVEMTWARLWQQLGRPGDPPAPGPLLDLLAAAALAQPETIRADMDAGEEAPVVYQMHAGVAGAIQAAAPQEIRDAVDAELADFWRGVAYRAEHLEGGEYGGMIVRAGLGAAPYLLRRHEWDAASTMLEEVIHRDKSPGTIQATLPALRRIVDATHTPWNQAILALALRKDDPAEAERLLRESLTRAAEDGNYRLASSIASRLINLLRETGRLGEALDLVEVSADYTRRAGLGPWTQLADQQHRLQILDSMGAQRRVLAEITVLRSRMSQLPERDNDNETVHPWSVREAILGLGQASARLLEEWEQCLDFSADILASQQRRNASTYEIARTRFDEVTPMVALGRLAEAAQLLEACQHVFEDHDDFDSLAGVFNKRAILEDELNHCDSAVDLERAAIRFSYVHPKPRGIAVHHLNLFHYLDKVGADPAARRAHLLAAALIFQLIGTTRELDATLIGLAQDLRASSGETQLPTTLSEVIEVAEHTEGVRLGELIAAIAPDIQAAEDALAQILRTAADLPAEEGTDVYQALLQWEPVIDAIAVTCRTGQKAPAYLLRFLDERAGMPDWAALAAVLRRILAGERGEALLDGLDAIDSAIVRKTLSRLTREDDDS